MSTENKDSIQNKTFFDTEHDNFRIDNNEESEITPGDVNEVTDEEAPEAIVEETPKGEEPGEEEEEGEEEEDDSHLQETQYEDPADFETEEEEEEADITEFSFSPLVEDLMEEGVIDVDNMEDYDDSPEGFRKIVSDTVEKKFDKMIKALSPKAQRLIELEMNGGDFDSLLQLESVDYNSIDMEDQDNQKLLISNKLEAEGYTEEEITERLQDLEDLGKLDKEAKIAHRYLAKKDEERKEAMLEESRKQAEARQIEEAQRVEDFKKQVTSVRELSGIKLSKADADKLYEYITAPVTKEKGTNRVMTQYEIDSSFENRLKQAYMQMKGFNYSDIQRKAETKVSLKVKKAVSHYKDTNQKSTTMAKPKEDKISTKIPNHWAGDMNNTL